MDDAGCIDALVELLAGAAAIDRTRIHAMGSSHGRSKVHFLDREDATRWWSLALVRGNMTALPTWAFSPAWPESFLQIHGDADSIMSYAGGITPGQRGAVVSAIASVEPWRQRNGAAATPRVTALPNTTLDGCSSSRSLWAGGQKRTAVGLVTVGNGSHSWPGRPPAATLGTGNKTQDVCATDLAWDFFETCRRNDPPEIGTVPSAAPTAIVLP